MNPEQILRQKGIVLPPPPTPGGSYVPTVRTGNLIYVSGQVPRTADGQLLYVGKVGGELSLEQGQAAARQAALNALAAIRAELGSIDRIRRIVNVAVHVAGTPDFTDQHKVANGASDVLLEVFGEAGKHSRAALGTVSLPVDTPVELKMIVEVE